MCSQGASDVFILSSKEKVLPGEHTSLDGLRANLHILTKTLWETLHVKLPVFIDILTDSDWKETKNWEKKCLLRFQYFDRLMCKSELTFCKHGKKESL